MTTNTNSTPRLLLAGTHSGVGKTTLTSGLIAALNRRGLLVQPFKVGPDYIDPSYHSLAAGRTCRNLDAWLVPPAQVQAIFDRATQDCDLAMIEGVMGLFDGFGYDDEQGSTAEMAKLLWAPVVVIVDAAKLARSAGALAAGYVNFDRELSIAGFIVNRVGSPRHGQGVARAIERATGKPVFGWLPREARLTVPERHLGLVPTVEPGAWHPFLAAAGDLVEQHLDVDRLLDIARQAAPLEPVARPPLLSKRKGDAERIRIAVARDAAFQFTYPENLELMTEAGAEIAFFSPLADASLPEGTAAIVLSGGFPEVYARDLAANAPLRESIVAAHRAGMPIYAECGGLMYLTEAVIDQEGCEHEMVGLLPGRSRMTPKLTLGYRLAEAASDSWLFRRGETVRGHEFHYSIWQDRPLDVPAALRLLPRDGDGEAKSDGACVQNLWASYVHLHFVARPELARRLIDAADDWARSHSVCVSAPVECGVSMQGDRR
jgi:cobyrinic acid a,c-diamide synthase